MSKVHGGAILLLVALTGCSSDEPADRFGHTGCPSTCSADQVCLEGTCQTAGPDKGCGSETFGSGLPASGVLYVDGSVGQSGVGSEAQPFRTIGEALAVLSSDDTIIAVAAGTYEEDLVIEKTAELRCRCPSQVTIAGTITVNPPAAGGADAVVIIDGCRVAPSGFADQATDWGECVSKEEPKGISARGINHSISLLIRDSVVAGWCTGIYFSVLHELPNAGICVSRSRVFANVKGLDVQAAPTPIFKTLFDGCQGIHQAVGVELSQVDQNRDCGIYTREGAQGIALRGNSITMTGRIGSKNGGDGYGVLLGNTESAHVISNSITDNENRGLAMINLTTLLAAEIVIDGNTLVSNRIAGISLQQLQAKKAVQITDNLIQGTLNAGEGSEGDGIQVSVKDGTSYDVTVTDNTVEDNARNGITLEGVGGTVSSNRVQDSGGYGVLLNQSTAMVGDNSWDGNDQGNVKEVSDPTDLCGSLPVPLP